MAKDNLAQDWFDANPQWLTREQKAKRRERIKRSERYRGKTPIFYHPLEELAFGRWRHNEKKAARDPAFTVDRFLEENKDFRFDECLLLPFHVEGVRASAARKMCSMAHGASGSDQVARHICGNGHLSCVNPRHLAWGTPEQNIRDRWLHTARPRYMPEIAPEAKEAIIADKRLPNVIAVAFDVPAAIVEYLKRRA